VIVVPDAGPLIYLAGAGHLAVLPALYDEVATPRVVWDEVTVAGDGLVGAAEVRAAASWLRVEDVEPDPLLATMLDRGEAAAIPLAERLRATLLVDDADAREVAAERGISVVGTLGVLLLAKRRGLLPAVAAVLDRMTTLGMFVAPDLRAHVLAAAGESDLSS
jgi:predicted nucleic acid-binding protein